MNRRGAVWLRISGTSGILAPIVAFVLISLAIVYSPQFNWTENALSDLGVQEGITPTLFNYALVTVGIFALIFASGLLIFLEHRALGTVGAFMFILAALALTTIGVFPENMKPMHLQASVAFFVLYPLATLVIAATFLLMKDAEMGLFTFATAAVSAVVWVVYFTAKLVPGVAVPEAISAASASVWAIVSSFRMLNKART